MNGRIPLNGSNEVVGNRRSFWAAMRKLAHIGIGVKRWLLLGSIGVAICSIGLAFILKNALSLYIPDVLPGYTEGILVALLGVVALGLAVYGMYRSVLPLLMPSSSFNSVADTIYRRRSRGRGPRVVAIGGGTGLSVLLRGLKLYTDNLTAIVTVGDDGGSSGRLRRELNMLPPGDFRNCLVAMADDESLVTDLFQYRFDKGEGLEGHSFGNLFIAAMASVTGSFEQALYESSKVLAVHGQILPSTMSHLKLVAEYDDGNVVSGESSIGKTGGIIKRVNIDPHNAVAYTPALEAIQHADIIIVGPGSLYTSIIPNLLVKGITESIVVSKALKIFVCNVATEKGETDGFAVKQFVETLQAHSSPTVADFVLVNDRPKDLGERFLGQPVSEDGQAIRHAKIVRAYVVNPDHPTRHDSTRLANIIMGMYDGRHRMGDFISSKETTIAGVGAK